MKHSFEFELKDFNKSFNQNKEMEGIKSAEYKYGAYKWSLQADVKKYLNQENGDIWFIIRFYCESDDQNKFPLFTNMKFLILNKGNYSREDLSTSNSY